MVFEPYINAPGAALDSYQVTTNALVTVPGTTDTLITTRNGKIMVYTSSSPVTVTVPSGLPVGFNCSIVQYGTGQVTVNAGAGATMRLRSSANKTGGQYAVISLLSVVANEYIVTGDATSV